jgi:hypothetical protein
MQLPPPPRPPPRPPPALHSINLFGAGQRDGRVNESGSHQQLFEASERKRVLNNLRCWCHHVPRDRKASRFNRVAQVHQA